MADHLTNAAIQKQTAQYKDDKEESIWHMDRLKEYAVQTSLTLGMQDWWNSSFCPAVMHIVKELSRVIETTVQPHPSTFTLYGIDLMLDDQLQTYLLEVNSNPAIHTSTSILKEVIPEVVEEAIDIALWLHNRPWGALDQEGKESPVCRFELIRNVESGFWHG
eukprot:Platyproteum_vivax@DN6931_c0_g1_i1.p2